jgi:hypothetical protein
METWEQVVVGALMVLVVFWFFPKIKPRLEQDKDAPKDWAGVLVPVGLVVIFVLFLVSTL